MQLNDYQQKAMQQIYDDKISRIDSEILVLSRMYNSFGEEREFMIGNYVDCDFDRFKYVIDKKLQDKSAVLHKVQGKTKST